MSALTGPLDDQRDQHGETAGDERTDDRDEAADERDDGERVGQRHPEDHQADADEHRVDEAHQRLGPDEAAERRPAAAQHLGDVRRGGHPDRCGAATGRSRGPSLSRKNVTTMAVNSGDQRRRRGPDAGEQPGGDLRAARVQPVVDRRDAPNSVARH